MTTLAEQARAERERRNSAQQQQPSLAELARIERDRRRAAEQQQAAPAERAAPSTPPFVYTSSAPRIPGSIPGQPGVMPPLPMVAQGTEPRAEPLRGPAGQTLGDVESPRNGFFGSIGARVGNVPENILIGAYGMGLSRNERQVNVDMGDITGLNRGQDALNAVQTELDRVQAAMESASRQDRPALEVQFVDLTAQRNQLRLVYPDVQSQVGEEQVSLRENLRDRQTARAGVEAAQAALVDPKYPGTTAWLLGEGAGSIAEMAPAVIASLAAGPEAGGAYMYALVYGQSYVDGRRQGLDPDRARSRANLFALAEAIPETMALGEIIKASTGVVRRIVGGSLAEGAQESITQVMQEGIDQGYNLSPDMTWGQFLNEVGQAGALGMTVGGTLGAGVAGLNRGAQTISQAVAGRNQADTPSSEPTTPAIPPAGMPFAPVAGATPLDRGRNDPDRLNSTRLTPEDRASPIQNAVIDDGKAIIDNLLSDQGTGPVGAPTDFVIPPDAVPLSTLYGGQEEQAAPDPQNSAAQPAPVAPLALTAEMAAPPAAAPIQPAAAPSQPRPAQTGAAAGIEVLGNADIPNIATNAALFQYKSNTDQDGVSPRLRDVTKWDSNRTGIALVYEYGDGRREIVDGHQRLGLARRLVAQGQNVDLPARILRETDGITPADARRIGAEKNIAEGTGTAIDAAKVFRESGMTAKQLNLPRDNTMVRNGEDIAKLSDQAFGMVINEVASDRDGALVGRLVPDQARHADILGLLARAKPANATQAEFMIGQANDTSSSETQTDMFGDLTVSTNLVIERAKVIDQAMRDLGSEISTFKTLVTRGDTITQEGNTLVGEANSARLTAAEQARANLMKQANTKGVISDALTAAARTVKEGGSVTEAARQFAAVVRNASKGNGPEAGDAGSGNGRPQEGGPQGDVADGPSKSRAIYSKEDQKSIIFGLEEIFDEQLALGSKGNIGGVALSSIDFDSIKSGAQAFLNGEQSAPKMKSREAQILADFGFNKAKQQVESLGYKPVEAADAAKGPSKASVKPTYIMRPVLNADAIRDWAISQGFKSTVPEADMHVTVLYSKTPVDQSADAFKADDAGLSVEGGSRKVEKFGEAVVLRFEDFSLQDRNDAMMNAGAKSDFPNYKPHITISYKADGLDLTKIEPYRGPIELGGEVVDEIREDAADQAAKSEVPAPESVQNGQNGQTKPETPRSSGRPSKDLFDQPGARGPGERQMDIEDLIDEATAEKPKPAPKPAASQAPAPSTIKAPLLNDTEKAKLDALLAAMRDKLNSQTSAGLDPEFVSLAVQAAEIYVKAGVRRFRDFVQNLARDLGVSLSKISRYARIAYNDVRDEMEASGEGVADMDDSRAVIAELSRLNREEAEAPKAEPEPAPEPAPKLSSPEAIRTAIVDGFTAAFRAGEKFRTIIEARKKVEEYTNGAQVYSPDMAKGLEEMIEAAVVVRAREIVAGDGGPLAKYDALVLLYAAQPRLDQRTSTSIEMQAYSTPAPLAYLASRLANAGDGARVYEPTAGNGMLLMEVDPKNIIANEMQPERVATLRDVLGSTAKITEGDAMLAEPGRYQVLLTNPPFGKVRDDTGQTLTFELAGVEGRTTEIDHAIVMRGLDALPVGGRAVLIIGGQKYPDQEQRRVGYTNNGPRQFFKKLYDNYIVSQHFTADGKLYERQGAAWPVDVIVIEGKGRTTDKPYPMREAPPVYSDWDALRSGIDGKNPLDARRVASGDRDGGNDTPDQTTVIDGIPLGTGTQNQNPDRGNAPAGGTEAIPADGGNSGQPDASNQDGGRSGTNRVGESNPVREGGNGNTDLAGPTEPDQSNAARPDAGKPDGAAESERLSGPSVSRDAVTRQNAEVETSFQVQYTPRSASNFAVGTLVPKNMQAAMTRALDDLESRVGNIDNFVAAELGYAVDELLGVASKRFEEKAQRDAILVRLKKGNEALARTKSSADRSARSQDAVRRIEADLNKARAELRRLLANPAPEGKEGYFSAEQVDALALAIDNVSKGKAFIIGDQTGVGKGRFVAAMLRYAERQGMVPVFVTKDPGLYADMIRDMRDIGMKDVDKSVFITNTDITPAKAIPLSTDNPTDVIKSAKPQAYSDQLSSMMGGQLSGGAKMVFTTYSQMQQVKGADTQRQAALRGIASNAMFVLDESHEAGGGASQRQKAGTMPRGEFIRQLLQNARGAVFSSATYAKNPDVMSLYAKTDLALMVDDPDALADAIRAGGVPLQQIIANMLVDAGQYARREKSYEGIELNLSVMNTDRALAERGSEAMRTLFRLDVDVMQEARAALIKEKTKEGAGGSLDGAVGDIGMSSTNFASTMHNLAAQFLLAIKTEAAVAVAVERFKAGEKVIITVSNTNETMMQEQVEMAGLQTGDVMDLPFGLLFDRYLERLRRITVKDENDNKTHIYMSDSDIAEFGPPGALKAFNRAKDTIRNSGVNAMSASPIDTILDALEDAGMNVGEITGRGMTMRRGMVARREASPGAKKRIMNDFNSGKLDALVINRSGSTGFSMHATGRPGNDGKPRHMIILQPEANIDVFMQLLGRINRTGQIVLPGFTIAVSDLSVEKRPAAVLMKKLASLNANTTASKKGAIMLEVVDFLNVYGDQVIVEYLGENPQMAAMLDLDYNPAEPDGLAAKFTGRLAIMPPDQVDTIYAAIEENYKDFVAALDRMGLNALEAKTLELDAKTKASIGLVEARDESSPFGRAAYLETVDVKRLSKPFTSAQLQTEIDALIGKGENPTSFLRSQLRELQGKTPGATERINARIARYLAEVQEAETDAEKNAAQMGLANARSALSSFRADMNAVEQRLVDLMPGEAGTLTVRQGENVLTFAAVSLGADISKVGANPTAASSIRVRIAINDGGREVRLPLSRLLTAGGDASYAWAPFPTGQKQAVYKAFDSGQTNSREERQMITGNIPAGYAAVGRGQIIMYTDSDGGLRQGVLLPAGFDAVEMMEGQSVKFADPAIAIDFISEQAGSRQVRSDDGVMAISKTSDGEISMVITARGSNKYILNRAVQGIVGVWERRNGAKFYRKSMSRRQAIEVMTIYQQNLGTEYETSVDRERAREMTGVTLPGERPMLERASDAMPSPMTRPQAGATTVSTPGGGIGLVTPIGKVQAKAIITKLQLLGQKLGLPQINFAIYDDLFQQLGPDIIPVHGLYFGGAMQLALNANGEKSNVMRTAAHEFIHAMRSPWLWPGREFGLFRKAEWETLEREAEKDEDRISFAVTAGYPESQIIEEVVANRFADWMEGRKEQGFVKAAFERLAAYLDALGQALRGNGFTTEQLVFLRAERGVVGRRGAAQAKQSRAPTQAQQREEARYSKAQAKTDEAVSKFIGEDVTSAVNELMPVANRKETFLRTAMVQPLDAAFRIPFMMVGGLDNAGRWRYGKALQARIKRVVVDADAGFMSPLVERVRAGIIDRYGLPQEYVDREQRRGTDEALILADGVEHVKHLMQHITDPDENAVLQAVLTGEAVPDAKMAKLSEPIRKSIDDLGAEAVALGLLSREAYERNRGSYLHRVYAKHEEQSTTLSKWAETMGAARRKKIVGNQFKGRGIFEQVSPERILRDNEEFLGAKRGIPQAGDKIIVLELRSTDNTAPLNGMDQPKGRLQRRVYWPANVKIPAKLDNFTNRGTFEVRGVKGGDLVLWRDFTKAERTKMGEILDVRYTVAKTYSVMAADLATGRFFKDIAENEEWSRKEPPADAKVQDDPSNESWLARLWIDPQLDWVKVPETKISKSDTFKYGALAGRYVRADIWRDMEELRRLQTPSFFRALMTQWKLNKTARVPVVHMNNVMSNFMLADMADVRSVDLARGLMSFYQKDAIYQEAVTAGAFGADMVANEMRDDIMRPLLKELSKQMSDGKGGFEAEIGRIGRVIDMIAKGASIADGAMLKAYAAEDHVFRMATYIRRRDQGMTVQEAAAEARDQFLNYDIRAPWINAARQTVLPFISYTYRAVPKLAQTILERPWKVAKYAAITQAINMMAYAVAPSDDDEDRERGSLRAQEEGFTWFGGERLVRMPWLDDQENPVFLDIRRWVPAGDVFDTGGNDVPAWLSVGGPLLIAAELYLNRAAFTGDDITNPLTTTFPERLRDRADYLYKSWMPSAPWVPNGWYFEKIRRAIQVDALEWGSNTPYNLSEALLSSLGIKLQARDVDVGYQIWAITYDREKSALQMEASNLRGQAQRNLISEETYRRSMGLINDKMMSLQQRIQERFQ